MQCFRNRKESHRGRYLGFANGCDSSEEAQPTVPASHQLLWTGTFLSECVNKYAMTDDS